MVLCSDGLKRGLDLDHGTSFQSRAVVVIALVSQVFFVQEAECCGNFAGQFNLNELSCGSATGGCALTGDLDETHFWGAI